MQAAILAVGSELLGTDRLDTNSLRITQSFQRYGVELKLKSVVADDVGELAAEVAHALELCHLVVVTGGIGPTTDDITREAVARALGRKLVRDQAIVDDIRRKFARFGREMPASNSKQGDLIEGARVLDNHLGTAPGQRIDDARGTIFLLPGVPKEVEGLIPQALDPWLAERSGDRGIEMRHLRIACVSESSLEQLVQSYYEEYGSRGLSVLSKPGEVLLQIAGIDGSEERAASVEARVRRLAEILGDSVYGYRREDTLEGVVGGLLRAGGLTVATAESCTGGLVAERLTRMPGSSQYFLGSTVTYSYELKCELLGIPRAVLEKHGAVSREVVTGMALGGRSLLGADYCIAISGVAGPGGGTPDKPVGTVDLAVAGPNNDSRHLRARFPGDRAGIREQAAQWGLDMLRRWLLATAEPDATYLAPRVPAVARDAR